MALRVPLITAGIACLFMQPALADPLDDATYIVEQTVSDEYVTEIMSSMAELMAAGIVGELSQQGHRLSNDAADTIVELMMPTLVSGMSDEMRAGTVEIYREHMSPESLAAYRKFLESPAGQETIVLLPVLARAGAALGEEIGPVVGQQAAMEMFRRISSGQWPDGTSGRVKAELKGLMNQ